MTLPLTVRPTRATGIPLWLACALCLVLAPTPGRAETLRLAYMLYFGLVPTLDLSVTLKVADGTYHVAADVAPQAWVAWMVPWTAQSQVSGRVEDGKPRPERFEATASWGVRARTSKLDFGPDGTIRVTLHPPLESVRDPVPEALRAGALDPVSALVALFLVNGRGEGCPVAIPVFDGRRRFDIRAERLPDAPIPASDYSAYAGPARVCRLRFVSRAGGYSDQERSRFWQGATDGERPPMELAQARLHPNLPPVPVSVTGESMLGWASVWLSSYTITAE